VLRLRKDVVGIGTCQLLDRDTGGRVPIQRTVRRIGIRAELYASHIFEPDYRTIAVRLNDDILVVWDLVEFTLVSQHIFVHFLAALTQPAGSGLETLIL